MLPQPAVRRVYEADEPGDKEYVYAPTFLSKTRAAMGDEKFDAFLKDVYKTYTGKVANAEGSSSSLRSHDDSTEVEKIISFFFGGGRNRMVGRHPYPFVVGLLLRQ